MPLLLFKVTHYSSCPIIIRKATKDQSRFTNKTTFLFHKNLRMMLPEGQQMYNLLPHYLFNGPGVISSINGFSVMTYPTIKYFTHL